MASPDTGESVGHMVAAWLFLFGLARLVAAVARRGKAWGGCLLVVTVALPALQDLREAVVYLTASQVLVAGPTRIN